MKTLLKGKSLTQREFAATIEENTTHINKVLNGTRAPSYDLLTKFMREFPEVDLNWLLRDEYQTNGTIPTVEEGGQKMYNIQEDLLKIEELLENIKRKTAQ